MGPHVWGPIYGAPYMGPHIWAPYMGPYIWGPINGAPSMGPYIWAPIYGGYGALYLGFMFRVCVAGFWCPGTRAAEAHLSASPHTRPQPDNNNNNIDKIPDTGTLRIKRTTGSTTGVQEYVNYDTKVSFSQDVINALASNDTLEVASTTGLSPGGQQTVVFDTPFSNVVANKVYYVATVPTATTFTLTETQGSSTPIPLVDAVGSPLSPLSRASSGYFDNIVREQSGNTNFNLTAATGASSGTVSSSSGIQKGQRIVGIGVPADTFVHDIDTGNNTIVLSKAVTASNPTQLIAVPMGATTAQSFTYSATQPTSVELLAATSVPQISHWGSSVIMDGRFDDDRAYVYTYGTKTGREIDTNQEKALIALRVAPSVDNGVPGSFGSRELVNRMQLVLRSAEVSANGPFYIEILLNPILSTAIDWFDVGGTSLAQYADLTKQGSGDLSVELVGGEVIFGFYVGNGVNTVSLASVKEISNSILGGGLDVLTDVAPPNPTGVFPDGPEVIAIRAKNLAGGKGANKRSADVRISWTEAQA